MNITISSLKSTGTVWQWLSCRRFGGIAASILRVAANKERVQFTKAEGSSDHGREKRFWCSSRSNKSVSPTSTKPLHTSNRTNRITHSRSYGNLSILSAHSSEVQKRHGPWLRCYSPGLQFYRYLSEALRTQGRHMRNTNTNLVIDLDDEIIGETWQ